MKSSITFALNDLFKESNGDPDNFWFAVHGQFKFVETADKWPLIQRSGHVIQELRPFFECNNVYDLLRKDDEDIRLVLQERKPYSGMTLKMNDEVKAIFPKASWFIQRQPKRDNWEKKKLVPLQDTFVFAWPAGDGSHCMWGDTRQPDGIVHVVDKLRADKCDLNPNPIRFG